MTDAEKKVKAEANASAAKEALAKAKSKDGPQKVEIINGLRVTSGAVPDKCVRVLVLRNHDGNGRRAFYRAGEIVDIYHAYYIQQTTPKDENGHEWKVTPAPFELLK
jgi:hypothetical protein